MRPFRLRHRLASAVGAATVALAFALGSPGSASAAAPATCHGGPIAPGSYSSLEISGTCLVIAGDVSVQKNLTVLPDGVLLAIFGGSTLSVGGNLVVESGGILALGCEPVAFPCRNDPDASTGGTMSTNDSIGKNLSAAGALMVLAHHNTIGGNLSQSSGGGGVNCTTFPLGPSGPPAYSTYEDNVIGSNASITGVQTCWLGFIRNRVSRNVNYNDDITFDPDGNEVVTNTIQHNLNCSGNSPAPQIGDSSGVPNTVMGRATGQCVGLVAS